jgi:hypothetical protein
MNSLSTNNNRRIKITMNIRALVIAGLILLGTSFTASAQTWSISRSVIGSGMTPTSGGGYVLDGTIGQAIIGPAVGSNFTALSGFWYTLVPGPLGVATTVGGPAGFALEQNYPNPFNSTTSIDFSIPERTKVTIRVINLLGEQMGEAVVDEVKDAGTYSIPFDADNLPSGTYICSMQAGDFSASKQMMLVK